MCVCNLSQARFYIFTKNFLEIYKSTQRYTRTIYAHMTIKDSSISQRYSPTDCQYEYGGCSVASTRNSTIIYYNVRLHIAPKKQKDIFRPTSCMYHFVTASIIIICIATTITATLLGLSVIQKNTQDHLYNFCSFSLSLFSL